MRTRTSFALLLSFGITSCDHARPIARELAEAGVQTTAIRSRVFTHPLGFSFTYPDGWTVQQTEQGIVLAPPDASEAQPEIYLITADHGYRSSTDPRVTRELDELAANLFPHLQRSGGVQPFAGLSDGAVHTWEGISRQNGAAARVRVFVRVINDYAVSVTAMGDRAALERREPLIRGVATSLTFAAPGGPGSGAETTPRVAQGGQPSSQSLSDGSPVAQQWLERLRGKRLTSLSSYSSGGAGGYSSRTVVMLWPDGRFDGQSSSSVSVDVPGASGSSGGSGSTSGRWRIYATRDGLGVLELTYANGRQEQNVLQDRNGQTFINGSRWFVTNPQ